MNIHTLKSMIRYNLLDTFQCNPTYNLLGMTCSICPDMLNDMCFDRIQHNSCSMCYSMKYNTHFGTLSEFPLFEDFST